MGGKRGGGGADDERPTPHAGHVSLHSTHSTTIPAMKINVHSQKYRRPNIGSVTPSPSVAGREGPIAPSAPPAPPASLASKKGGKGGGSLGAIGSLGAMGPSRLAISLAAIGPSRLATSMPWWPTAGAFAVIGVGWRGSAGSRVASATQSPDKHSRSLGAMGPSRPARSLGAMGPSRLAIPSTSTGGIYIGVYSPRQNFHSRPVTEDHSQTYPTSHRADICFLVERLDRPGEAHKN